MARQQKALETIPRQGSNAKRAARNRAINQRELRLKIAAGNHHGQIEKTLQEVDTLHKSIVKYDSMTRDEQASFMSKLGALKVKLDAQFRLLNKYLPDVRTIDFDDGQGNSPLEKAIAAWADAIGDSPDGG